MRLRTVCTGISTVFARTIDRGLMTKGQWAVVTAWSWSVTEREGEREGEGELQFMPEVQQQK